MRFIRLKIVSLISMVSLFLSGCGVSGYDSTYLDVKDKLALQEAAAKGNDLANKAHKNAAESMYAVCVTVKQYAPFIMIGSFLAGLALFIIFRRDKGIRKWSLFFLMIGIPGITFVCTYLLCFLYGCFNF